VTGVRLATWTLSERAILFYFQDHSNVTDEHDVVFNRLAGGRELAIALGKNRKKEKKPEKSW